jgi:hypothetical protein
MTDLVRGAFLTSVALVACGAPATPATRPPEASRAPEQGIATESTFPPVEGIEGCKAAIVGAVISPNGLLHVPARLGTKTGLLVADTGANRSMFAQGFTEGSASTPARFGLLRFTDVNLGPFRYPTFDASVSAAPVPSDLPGAVGFAGTDVLDQFLTIFDWRASTISFIKEADARECVNAWRFPAIALEDYGSKPPEEGPPNIPTLRVRIPLSDEGASLDKTSPQELSDIPVQLDTGSYETEPRAVLHVNRALGALLRKRLPKMSSRTSSFAKVDGKRVDVITYDAPAGVAVVSGAIHFSPITFIEHPPESEGAYARPAPYGVLGATALRKLGRIAVDPFHRSLWVMTKDGASAQR